MSYDIPDEIKYKEKIVFGLDFRQLGYASAFLALAVLAYNLPLTGTPKLILPAFLAIAGFAFVFLNLDEKILDAYHFYTGIKVAKAADARAQKLIGIQKVENNAIHLTNGDLRAVVSVEPVNLGLLEESQRNALILNYREFLNHLTTPIQILVRTSKPDLEDYFSEAQARLEGAPDKLMECFRDFMMYEQTFLENNHVRTRSFYVVIAQQLPPKRAKKEENKKKEPKPKEPPKPDENTEQTTEGLKLLEQKTKIIQEKLSACGLKTTRLETANLHEFLSTYSSQERDTNEEKPLEQPPKATVDKSQAKKE